MTRKLIGVGFALAMLLTAARAEELEVPALARCRPVCRKRQVPHPSPALLGAQTGSLGPVVDWLASQTCEQFLVPQYVFTKIVPIDGPRTAADIRDRLRELVSAVGLSSRGAAITRISEASSVPDAVSTDVSAPESPPVELDIRCVAPGRCAFPRKSLGAFLADTTQIASSVRIDRAIKDGKAVGFKLYALRVRSVFAELGLQNGDTLKTINGRELGTPDHALEVYSELRGTSHIVITIDRHGEPVTIELTSE